MVACLSITVGFDPVIWICQDGYLIVFMREERPTRCIHGFYPLALDLLSLPRAKGDGLSCLSRYLVLGVEYTLNDQLPKVPCTGGW